MDDFETLVEQLTAAKVAKARSLGVAMSAEDVRSDVADRLEDLINAALMDECQRRGRGTELSRVIADEKSDPQAFFQSVIPNYQAFMRDVIAAAAKKIV